MLAVLFAIEFRLWAAVVLFFAVPLCAVWSVWTFQQALERQSARGSWPMYQLGSNAGAAGGVAPSMVVAGVGSGTQPYAASGGSAESQAGHPASLRVALALLVAFSTLAALTAMSTLKIVQAARPRQRSKQGGATSRVLASAGFDAGYVALRDAQGGLHALGTEFRRQVGDLSHEMRTPLAIISGSLHSVRRALPADHQKAARSAELIEQSCEKLVELLDSHRHATARLVDTFLGPRTSIDIGAFLQDAVAHSGVGRTIALAHPSSPMMVRTYADGLQELMKLFLVAVPERVGQTRVQLSFAPEGRWTAVNIGYERPRDGASGAVLLAIEWASWEARRHLGVMDAIIRTRIDAGGVTWVQLLLPPDNA